jgi:hypothetical protein
MPTLALSHRYVCRSGAPVIHSVDLSIYSLRYFMRCMACGFCNDQCCNHGVDIDTGNAERLLALGPDFQERVAVPQSEWFTPVSTADIEFPSGAHVRTRVHNGKCAFINRDGRGCSIHAYSLDRGLDYHTLKPMVSTLFPITFEQGVLVPSSEVLDGSLVCSGEGATLYEGARSELAYYFGLELVEELDELSMAPVGPDKVAR